MRNIILFCLAALALHAQDTNSTGFDGASYLRSNVSNISPFNSVTNMEMEFRISNYSASLGTSGNTGIAFMGGIYIYLGSSSNNILFSDAYTSSTPQLSLTGSPDATLRLIWSAGYEWAEKWTVSGGRYVCESTAMGTAPASPANFSGSPAIGLAGGTAQPLNGRIAYFRVRNINVPTPGQKCRVTPVNTAWGNIFDYELPSGAGRTTDSSGNNVTLSATGSGFTNNTTAYQAQMAVTDLNGGPSMILSATTRRSGVNFTLDGSGSEAASYLWTVLAGSCTLSNSTSAVVTVIPAASGYDECDLSLLADGSTIYVEVGLVPTDSVYRATYTGVAANLAKLLGPLLAFGVTPWTQYDFNLADRASYYYGNYGSQSGDSRCACTWDSIFNNSEGLTYYDGSFALYRQLYFRTGLTRFKAMGDALVDYQWAKSDFWNSGSIGGMGNCYQNGAPRRFSMRGMWTRVALSGVTTMVACLEEYADFALDVYLEPYYGQAELGFDAREPGYAMTGARTVSLMSPNSGTRSSFATRLQNAITSYVLPAQCTVSNVTEPCTTRAQLATGTLTVSHNSASVTGNSTLLMAEFGAATTILIHEGAVWTRYTITPGTSTAGSISPVYAGSNGTYSIARTTPLSRTGSWSWSTVFADIGGYFEQSWQLPLIFDAMMNLYDETPDPAILSSIELFAAHHAADAFDSTTCAGVSGISRYWTTYLLYGVGWAPPLSDVTCGDAATLAAGRTANNEVHAMYGWLYRVTGNTTYKTIGDQMFAANFGFYSGPGADGYGGQSGESQNGKQFGQSFATTGSYLADRLAVIPSRSIQPAGDLQFRGNVH